MQPTPEDWPPLAADRDGPTIAALHLFTQIAGKVPTRLLPWRNHGWHLTLHVTSRGLATEPIHASSGTFQLAFDLVDHRFLVEDAQGRRELPLRPTSVADFHEQAMHILAQGGHEISIHPAPNEIDPAIPFAEDRRPRAYDPDSALRLGQALRSADRVFRLFRSSFLGKVSPVHFFWGSFDLAVTRFSGRSAPLHPGGIPNLSDAVTREAYSHEVSSAGFWPGGAGGPGGPLFYSYAYPAPEGFADQPIRPAEARWDADLKEFILDYEDVRTASDPDAALLAFLQSSYEAAANLAFWDRAALECSPGLPGIPRAVKV